MGSTDLITYLNYVSNWESESDENVNRLISELNMFLEMDDFEFRPAINEEFKTLTDLAMEVKIETIASDAIQIAADAVAISSIWSFGLGMAEFAALEAVAIIGRGVTSIRSAKLHKKLIDIDIDIAAKMNREVRTYIENYKANNRLINTQAPKGLNNRMCRSYLMQFMGRVQRKIKKDTLTPSIFKQYAGSAKKLFESKEIDVIYDALDDLNLSDRNEADVQKFMNTLVGLKVPEAAKGGMMLVQGVAIWVMSNKMKISNEKIKISAESEGIAVEEFDASAFEMMDACGKFASVVTAVMSVADIVLEIMDIVNVVQQSKRMCDELNGKFKQNYILFYRGIQEACKKYKKAIHANGTNEAIAAKTTKKEMTAFHTKVVPASADKSRCCVVL